MVPTGVDREGLGPIWFFSVYVTHSQVVFCRECASVLPSVVPYYFGIRYIEVRPMPYIARIV